MPKQIVKVLKNCNLLLNKKLFLLIKNYYYYIIINIYLLNK